MIGSQIGADKEIPWKQGQADHLFAIFAAAGNGDFGQKHIDGFFVKAFADHIFKPAFGMQDIP
jgi:hypothetical protein